MTWNRRLFLTACGAITIAACAPTTPMSQTSGTPALPDDLRPTSNTAFAAWVTQFRPRALSGGISGSTFDAAFAQAGFITGVITRDRTQIQTRRTLEEYLSIATSDERVSKGRAAFARHATTLDAIEARYGVDKRIVTAIWGMESQFGEKRGQISTVSATATLAFEGRRAAFYESQLIAALRILQNGDTTPAQLTGSWAGAMGHTQFIPISYQSFAVDFTGDGRRDIWGDDPTDALASTAGYLARKGWRSGLAWGAEAGTSNLSGNTIQPQSGGVRFTVTRNAQGVAIFEITSIGDKQDINAPAGIDMHWIVHPDPQVTSVAAETLIRDLDWPTGRVQTCIAGESSVIRSLRALLSQNKGVDRKDLYISGYWKIGLVEDEHQQLKKTQRA